MRGLATVVALAAFSFGILIGLFTGATLENEANQKHQGNIGAEIIAREQASFRDGYRSGFESGSKWQLEQLPATQ